MIHVAQAPDHVHQYDAAYSLWNFGSKEDKAIARTVWIHVAQTPDHAHQYDATLFLWEYGKAEDKAIARPVLRQIAQTPGHVHQYDVARTLWNFGDEADKAIARPVLIEIAKIQDHARQYDAAKALWCFGNVEDKAIARPVLIEIAKIQDHARQYDAASELWHSSKAEDKAIARIGYRQIAQTPGHVHQLYAIKSLRESNDPEDQRLGLELKQRYFPVVLLPKTKKRQEQYNLVNIRSIMPQRLADLSVDKMDIVAEMGALMDKISAHEKRISIVDGKVISSANPYYIAPSAITGSELTLDLAEIKLKALGFLKTLTGQPLVAGETGGWQMYDENKPDMINTIKHLIIAVQNKLDSKDATHYDPQGALLNLSTVLNGLLYCPTGQAEGLQTAVNALINFKNVQSSNTKEKVGTYIMAKSVIDQFRNAFAGGGGVRDNAGWVHAIARARMVLNAELNINNALPSYKEKISPVGDAEIPEFYNEFYQRFTPANIISEARRNIQTPDEFQIAISNDHKAAKHIKEATPISVPELADWLRDQRETPEVLAEKYDITDDWAEITDWGLMQIFIKMGFFNEQSEELQSYMNEILTPRRERELQDREVRESAKQDEIRQQEALGAEEEKAKAATATKAEGAATEAAIAPAEVPTEKPSTKEQVRAARLKALGLS